MGRHKRTKKFVAQTGAKFRVQKQRDEFKAKKAAIAAGGSAIANSAAKPAPDEAKAPTAVSKKLGSLSVDEFMDKGFFDALETEEHTGDDDDDIDAAINDDSEQDDQQDIDNEDSKVDPIEQHKKELEALKETDPEFYKYLQENDAQLLSFGGEDDIAEEEEDEDEEEAGGEVQANAFVSDSEESEGEREEKAQAKEKKRAKSGKQKRVVTASLLKTWIKTASAGSFPSTRKLVLAFRVGCYTSTGESKSKKPADKDKKKKKAAPSIPFTLEDSEVFNKLMIFCVRDMPALFDKHLRYDSTNVNSRSLPSSSSKWQRLVPLVRGYLLGLLHFFPQVTDPSTLSFLLKYTEPLVPYIVSIPMFASKFLKLFLTIWSSAEEMPRLLAFLCIHKMAIRAPYPFINMCLKGIYLTYVRNAKFTNAINFSSVNFMANCVVELCCLDPIATYQHAFVYIRQLAIHLRNALTVKSKEAYLNVYNWQFINSLRAWVKLICAAEGEVQQQIQPLIYPVVQVLFGVIGLVPVARFYPLRFHCLRFLLDIAQKTHTFINVFPHLIEVLDSDAFKKGHKPSSSKPPDFRFALKVTPKMLSTKIYMGGVFEQVLELLLTSLSVYSHSIAFPDLVVPMVASIKKFIKHSKNVTQNKELRQVIEKIEANSKWVQSMRPAFTAKNVQSIQFEVGVGKKSPFEQFAEQKQRAQAAAAAKRPREEEDGEAEPDEDEESGRGRKNNKRRRKGGEDAEEQDAKKAKKKGRKARADDDEDRLEEDGDMVEGEEDVVQDLDLDEW